MISFGLLVMISDDYNDISWSHGELVMVSDD